MSSRTILLFIHFFVNICWFLWISGCIFCKALDLNMMHCGKAYIEELPRARALQISVQTLDGAMVVINKDVHNSMYL